MNDQVTERYLLLLLAIAMLVALARLSWGALGGWRAFGGLIRRCWSPLRQMIGWILIMIGLLGLILPGPGFPLLVVGLALVGWRHPLIRRVTLILKRRLRFWAHQPGVRGWVGNHGIWLMGALHTQLRGAHTRLRGSWPSRRAPRSAPEE